MTDLLKQLDEWEAEALKKAKEFEEWGEKFDQFIDNKRIATLITSHRELLKERDFYKNYYDFSTSKSLDLSHLSKGEKK